MKEKNKEQVKNVKERREEKPSMEYVEKQNVQFVGLKELEPADQEQVKKIVHDRFLNLERELKHIKGLKVHFKKHDKGGRPKFSVHIMIEANTGPIEVNKLYSPVQWNPVAAVHMLMDKAKVEIIHKYKTNTDYRKPYEKGVL